MLEIEGKETTCVVNTWTKKGIKCKNPDFPNTFY